MIRTLYWLKVLLREYKSMLWLYQVLEQIWLIVCYYRIITSYFHLLVIFYYKFYPSREHAHFSMGARFLGESVLGVQFWDNSPPNRRFLNPTTNLMYYNTNYASDTLSCDTFGGATVNSKYTVGDLASGSQWLNGWSSFY